MNGRVRLGILTPSSNTVLEPLTSAILDRLLHKAHVINIKGRRYRLRDLESTLGNQRP